MKLLAASLALTILSSTVWAERADRDKPMQLEANRVSIDDAKKIQILEGDVILTKGTMVLKAERIIITEDRYGFQKGTAFGPKGGLASFRQKREGRDDYIEGQAERIEYDSNREVAELYHRAWVRNGSDEVKGDYIWYDAVSEKYLVTAGESPGSKAVSSRVRAVIQPRNTGTTPPPEKKGNALELKGAGAIGEAN